MNDQQKANLIRILLLSRRLSQINIAQASVENAILITNRLYIAEQRFCKKMKITMADLDLLYDQSPPQLSQYAPAIDLARIVQQNLPD